VALNLTAARPRTFVGKVTEFAPNKFPIVETENGLVGVVKTDNGFHAVLNRCPHMGAPVCVGSDVTSTTIPSKPFEYILGHENFVVRCPWHRWEFRIDTGQSIGNVTSARLLTFDVEVDGQDVFVLGRASRQRAKQDSGDT
jgi:nitrite reductase/ring-hydroxylating ferredoxin subunit